MKKILLFILIFISIISCSQKEKVLDKKSKKEVYEEIIKDIENMKTFKYTSSDSAMLSFYKGNSVNTFSLDKAGNGFSNQNGVQTYKVDGEVYIRSIGLTQKGETTTVILDSLTKSNTKEDMDYFDRNTMNVKNYLLNNIKNIEKLPNQKITKVDGKIKIEITDLKETEYGSLDSIEIYYQLNKGINYIFNRTVVYDNSTKKYKVTDNLVFNSEEKIELPKLMPQGTQLKLIRE